MESERLISVFPVWSHSVVTGKLGVIDESIRIESVVVWVEFIVLMNRPSSEPDRAALWQEHAFIPVVYW